MSETQRAARRRPPGGPDEGKGAHTEGERIVTRIGPVEIDWPRSVGYFGGIAAAVALEIIDPPVGLFLAAIPLIKMLDLPKAPIPSRLISQVFQGVAKPVGGDSQGTVRLVTPERGASGPPVAED